ncbi:MAG: 4Fe-4S binding protein [Fibrobacterota bacterium]
MIKIYKEKCGMCGVCAGVCPENAIKLAACAPICSEKKCTSCGKCVKACPASALELNNA